MALSLDAVSHLLMFTDLPSVRLVSRDMEEILADGAVWLACAERAVPGFEFCCDHFKKPQRRQFMALVFAMIKSTLTEGSRVALHSKADVHQLCKHLSIARQAVASHCSLEGGNANYFVAHVHFYDRQVVSALDRKPASAIFFAKPITLPSALGMGAVHLHFALRGGVFFVACRDDSQPSAFIDMPDDWGSYYQPRRPEMCMDLASVDSDMLMHYRGLSLAVNGPWTPALFGMLLFTAGKPAAAKAMMRGVLCVFCIRNGKPKDSTPFAHYLNLDECSR